MINFTADDMTSKFEFFQKKKNNLYLTESMPTDWMHMLDKNWDERNIPYSEDYNL